MSGYSWDPVVRVVPFNGAETVYWFADRLTDCGGHTRISLRYVEDQTIREDVNRNLRPTVNGLRPEVTIECVIASMDDQRFLAEIESALLSPKRCAVFLSLDGGVTERQVVLASSTNAEPLAGRTILGATFKLSLKCVALIGERPAMTTDPGLGTEYVSNGGFEEWSGGVPAGGWNGSSGVGTVAQETTIVNGGASSAKVTRSDGVTSFLFYSLLKRVPPQGMWLRFRGSVRSTVDLAATANGAFRVAFSNIAPSLYVSTDGKTWDSGNNSLLLKSSLAASWTTYETYIRMPSTIPASDAVLLRLQGYWASGESLYYDDLSVYGPVLRPGVSAW